MPSSSPALSSTLSLHDALPIYPRLPRRLHQGHGPADEDLRRHHRSRADAADRRVCRQHRSHRYPDLQLPPQRVHLPGPVQHRDLRSEEHTSELQSHSDLVCRLLPPPYLPLFPYTTLFRSTRAYRAGYTKATAQQMKTYADTIVHELTLPTGEYAGNIDRTGTQTYNYLPSGFIFLVPFNTEILDRKSTRLNSSHTVISYAVFFPRLIFHSFPTRRSSDLPALTAPATPRPRPSR